MKNKKSQTATEYLILLAVVIVVALVVVNTLGVFPGIGSSSNKKISDQKLASDVVGVTSYFIGDSYSIFNLKNNNYDTITVTEFRINQQANLTCNSSNTIPALPAVLNIGQSVTINCSVVNTSSYILSDRKTPLIGILYIDSLGATRLAGNVLTYDVVSLSSGGNGSSNTSGSAPTFGLLAYYPFDGNMSDMSGNGFNGNCNGATCPTLNSSGVIGSAYTFDGANDYINISSLTSSSVNYTFSLWVYSPIVPGGMARYLFDSQSGRFIVALADGNIAQNIGFYTTSTGSWKYLETTPAPKNWYYLTFVFDNSTSKVYYYRNGVFISNFTYVGNSLGGTTKIGTTYDNGAAFFNGTMDEFRIYNRTLNTSEISDLYTLGITNASRVLAMDFNSNGLNYLNLNYSNRLTGEQGINIQDNSIYNNSGNSSGLSKQYWWNGNTAGTSVINGSLQFDGVNDYITTSTNINGSNENTWSIWIKPLNTTTTQNYIWVAPTGTAFSNFFYIDGSTGNLVFSTVNQSGVDYRIIYYPFSSYIGSNQWVHVTGVRKAGQKNQLYINGVWVANSTNGDGISYGPILQSAANMVFGNSGPCFNGSIDDVIIWSRALNATEISTIYTEGVAGRTVNNTLVDNRNIPADSRVAYWSFNTNQSGNATDSWGINNGTCSGTTCPVWNSSGATQFNGVNNYGGSYNFDGSKYLDYSSQVIPIGAKSISFWIKTSSTTDGMLLDNCLRTSYNHGTTIDVNLLHSGKIIFWSLKGTVGVYRFNLESNTAINNNIWHYVTFAWDGTTNANAVKIYIDGSLDNTMTATATETTTATASLAVGSGADHSSKFNGSIDDIMIFNRSLSATEVSDLYNTQKLHINLDELNGTKATDTSGLGNNGTLTNYPTTATTAPIWNATGGRNGTGAYVFDGVDDYISISQTMFQPTTPLTYSAWVNRYSAPSANFAGVVTGPGSFGANAASYIMIADTSNYMYCYFFTTGNSWVYAKSNSIIPLNTWAHYTCQWNGTTALMYVNGIQQTTTASLSAIIYGPGTGQQFFAIGKYLGAPSVYWNGSIDNVLFFNRVLNSSEVLALYNSP